MVHPELSSQFAAKERDCQWCSMIVMPQMSACKGGLGAYPSENLKKSEVAKTCFPLF